MAKKKKGGKKKKPQAATPESVVENVAATPVNEVTTVPGEPARDDPSDPASAELTSPTMEVKLDEPVVAGKEPEATLSDDMLAVDGPNSVEGLPSVQAGSELEKMVVNETLAVEADGAEPTSAVQDDPHGMPGYKGTSDEVVKMVDSEPITANTVESSSETHLESSGVPTADQEEHTKNANRVDDTELSTTVSEEGSELVTSSTMENISVSESVHSAPKEGQQPDPGGAASLGEQISDEPTPVVLVIDDAKDDFAAEPAVVEAVDEKSESEDTHPTISTLKDDQYGDAVAVDEASSDLAKVDDGSNPPTSCLSAPAIDVESVGGGFTEPLNSKSESGETNTIEPIVQSVEAAASESRDIPEVETPASDSSRAVHSLEELKKGVSGIDWASRELHLSTSEFERAFNMTKDEFSALKKWKRQALKRKVGLF